MVGNLLAAAGTSPRTCRPPRRTMRRSRGDDGISRPSARPYADHDQADQHHGGLRGADQVLGSLAGRGTRVQRLSESLGHAKRSRARRVKIAGLEKVNRTHSRSNGDRLTSMCAASSHGSRPHSRGGSRSRPLAGELAQEPGIRPDPVSVNGTHATWAYSWVRPPSRSRRRTRALVPRAGGCTRLAGGFCRSGRCGRWPL